MYSRKAYNQILLPDGTIVPGPVVVEFYEDGTYSYHPLTAEEPFTEWIGGTFTFDLLPFFPDSGVETPSALRGRSDI